MTTPPQPENTMVAVVLSGTANDQVVQYNTNFLSLTLTSQSGKSVTLLSTAANDEFIHLNGNIEPLLTVSVPQDTYTAATATLNGAQYTCVGLVSGTGGLDTSTFSPSGPVPIANVTVNLPTPIRVTGTSMALELNLLVAQSESFPQCNTTNFDGFTATPTFSLTPLTLSARPTGPQNGKVLGMNGQIASIIPGSAGSGTFVLSTPGPEIPRTVSVAANASTAYQGVNAFSDLAVGTLVNLDGAIQPDSSLIATRIAVEDPGSTSTLTGPVLYVSASGPVLNVWGTQEQGALFNPNYVEGALQFSFGTAAFQTSSQLTNLNALPFVPTFNASTIVPGQNVYLSSTALSFNGGGNYPPVSAVTLLPQTINGSVSGSTVDGAFTVYTVNLAAYDLFPALAVQAGQLSPLNSPGQVEVYVDSNTLQLLTSGVLAPGNTLRFYGLIFNDNGTLRMDCAEVTDGVAENPPAPAIAQSTHQ